MDRARGTEGNSPSVPFERRRRHRQSAVKAPIRKKYKQHVSVIVLISRTVGSRHGRDTAGWPKTPLDTFRQEFGIETQDTEILQIRRRIGTYISLACATQQIHSALELYFTGCADVLYRQSRRALSGRER